MDITDRAVNEVENRTMRTEAGRTVIVGAGVGGLAAAMALAGQGLHVTVLERAGAPGGKMRQAFAGEAAIDAGPTVLTMKDVFGTLFARCGASLDDALTLTPLDLLARHAWSAEERLDLFADPERTADAIGDFAGAGEARAFRTFAADSAALYAMLDARFMRAARPPAWRLPLDILRHGGGVADLFRVKPFQSLWPALAARFTDPRLRQLFGRYATYVGSSPLRAPATLMLIAHAEQRGVWRVQGGMHALALAMQRAAERAGATFAFGRDASRIVVGPRGVEAVETAAGERFPASSVVFNGDAAALAGGLLGEEARRAAPAQPEARRSLSAVVACCATRTSGFPLAHHNVFFQADYASEFEDIFERRRMPLRPTVYICAQDRGDEGLAPGHGPERLQLLINAPAHQDGGGPDEAEIHQCLSRATQSLERCGLRLAPGPANLTTPTGFSALFPGTGGAIYGQACHGWLAPFRRPVSKSAVPGLYLAGGSIHPGPGVPMAAISGMLAADRILADLTSARPFQMAATRGGMSTR